MTLETVEQFNRELAAGVETINNYDNQISQVKMYISFAEANGDADKALPAAKQLADMLEERDKALAVLFSKTATTTYESFRRFVMDVGIKIELCGRMLEVVRRRKAQLEYLAATSGFETPEQRASFEKEIADADAGFDTQLGLASAMIPSKPMLISALGGASI